MSDRPHEDARPQHDEALMAPLAKRCAARFTPQIDAGEVDVVDLPDEGAVEIQADEWTLHLEGDPIALAFVAIEQEPERADELAGALRAAIAPDDLDSLRALNADLDGALATRLVASGDALSSTLAGLLQDPTTR